jgi:hypothetical protein
MQRKCERCEYWADPIPYPNMPWLGKVGECRRYPPEGPTHTSTELWPHTKAECWCGEFSEQEDQQA